MGEYMELLHHNIIGYIYIYAIITIILRPGAVCCPEGSTGI